jgi:hypothetical protein
MRANVAIFKRNMIRPRSLPPILPRSAFIEAAPLHHELGQPRNAVGDASGLIGGQVFMILAET